MKRGATVLITTTQQLPRRECTQPALRPNSKRCLSGAPRLLTRRPPQWPLRRRGVPAVWPAARNSTIPPHSSAPYSVPLSILPNESHSLFRAIQRRNVVRLITVLRKRVGRNGSEMETNCDAKRDQTAVFPSGVPRFSRTQRFLFPINFVPPCCVCGFWQDRDTRAPPSHSLTHPLRRT